MIRMRLPHSVSLLVVAVTLMAAPAPAQVEKTAHDLAAPSSTVNGNTANPCAFCHAPHNDNPERALWNHSVPGNSYKLYESSTLRATLSQPTGASRLCLSCHDGTIAVDDQRGRLRATRLGTISGKRSLGTDLSDDHPVSFTYDSALASKRGGLTDPSLLPFTTRLDEARQLQCTSCHDAHEERNPNFLVVDNRYSQLCVTCHQLKGWAPSAHAVSSATWRGAGISPWGESNYNTVAENGCANCHRVHSAGRPEWLLNFDREPRNCFVCHNGTGTSASKDVEREFRKFSAHPVEQSEWIHSPKEDPRYMVRHVSCSDCHNPHAAQASQGGPAAVLTALQGVRGIDTSGGAVAQASFQYEVCYACHGIKEQTRSVVIRKDPVTNTRLKFDPGNASYHPVVAPGRNPMASGLEPGYSPSSMILCTDCHNGDSSSLVSGPHGSIYEPILAREYDLQDPSPESYQAYSLCYKCHTQAAVLSDRDGFPHRKHVVELQASCATCHDAHGSRNNTSLINFMVRGKAGNTVVSPSTTTGRLEFQGLGQSQGQCYLTCHGSDHAPKTYSVGKQPIPMQSSPARLGLPAR